MATVGEYNNMLNNEPLTTTRTLYHSTLESAQLQEQSTLQELQQNTDNIERHEKLRATQVENNILKIQLRELKQKMKLQEECHKQETQELNKHLVCVRKENEHLILDILLMDEKLRQFSKETTKLREQISFLQQKMQPWDKPVQIKHNIAVSPNDIYRGPLIAKVKPVVRPQ
jgi:hypothetical protein